MSTIATTAITTVCTGGGSPRLVMAHQAMAAVLLVLDGC
jgi:hypothetical protein